MLILETRPGSAFFRTLYYSETPFQASAQLAQSLRGRSSLECCLLGTELATTISMPEKDCSCGNSCVLIPHPKTKSGGALKISLKSHRTQRQEMKSRSFPIERTDKQLLLKNITTILFPLNRVVLQQMLHHHRLQWCSFPKDIIETWNKSPTSLSKPYSRPEKTKQKHLGQKTHMPT